MKEDDKDVKAQETSAPESQGPTELSDDQLDGIAGGISSEPVYTTKAVSPLTSAVSGAISSPSVLTLPGNILAGK